MIPFTPAIRLVVTPTMWTTIMAQWFSIAQYPQEVRFKLSSVTNGLIWSMQMNSLGLEIYSIGVTTMLVF